MRPLTARQQRVLDFVRAFLEREGFPPTHAEIARGLGFRSANAASEHVRLLAAKGALQITPGVARGLRVAPAEEPSKPSPDLPLIGLVAAGQPILAEAHVEERIALPPELFRPRADYLLRVRGESMIDAGIRSGDLVAVHKTPEVAAGTIAVVRLEDEVTVKRWRRRGREVVLEAANSDFEPIVVDPARTTVAIEGRVVGLLRRDLAGGDSA